MGKNLKEKNVAKVFGKGKSKWYSKHHESAGKPLK
jgi:hypothetical protein